MPTTHGGRLQEMASQYRDALEAQNAAAADRITRGWLQAQARVQVEIDQLLAKMEAARAAGITPSPAWLYQQQRLAQVTDTIRAEVLRWAPHAEQATQEAAAQAISAAVIHARALAREAAQPAIAAGIEATFDDLNPENMATLLGHLAPGGPLRDLLVRTGGQAADAAEQTLIQGLLLGKGSDWITRGLNAALDVPRWRAETIARTEAMRAYRETSRLTYASSNVVGTWVWDAQLDRRTCVACIIQHGTEHPVTETLDGHPRCRCAMIPRTKSWADIHPSLADLPDTRPPVAQGRDWLKAQPEAVQRGFMGPLKYDAWKAGDISLEDMVARTHSPEWGSMRRERSMVEIREKRNPNDWHTTPAPEAQAPARLAPDWDRWEHGRDTVVRKADRHELDFAQRDYDFAKRYADTDAAQLADAQRLVKERQAELRAFVPDAKERAKVSRTDHTLKIRKENLKYAEERAAKSAQELQAATAKLEAATPRALPDWDPENPLAFYGDRVTIYDRTPSTAKHLQELEEVHPDHHHLLRDHYAEKERGGFYIGDRYVPDLDDLGYLRQEAPRGWPPGSTFDQVPGVYSPAQRVCACGGDAKGHGSTSLVLHEGGHALDAAYGTQGVGGASIPASSRLDYAAAVDAVPEAARARMNPYYRPDGNPTGWTSESWAEGFAAWTKVRTLGEEAQARAIMKALTDGNYAAWPDFLPLTRYFRNLVA